MRAVANSVGHEHWFTFGENVNSAFDMAVGPRKLGRLLYYVFDHGQAVETLYRVIVAGGRAEYAQAIFLQRR